MVFNATFNNISVISGRKSVSMEPLVCSDFFQFKIFMVYDFRRNVILSFCGEHILSIFFFLIVFFCKLYEMSQFKMYVIIL